MKAPSMLPTNPLMAARSEKDNADADQLMAARSEKDMAGADLLMAARSEKGKADADQFVGLQDVRPAPVNWATHLISALFFPLDLLHGWVMVRPNEVVAVSHLGEVTSVHRAAGCFKVPCFAKEERHVSIKQASLELHPTKVVDAVGAPVMVAAVLNYRVVEPMKALYAVEDYTHYVAVNAQATLKHVVSAHSYNELKSNAEQVNRALCDHLAPLVERAGITVISLTLSELNYAPEIAAAMLKKQQAGALIEARSLIVEGAVRIAKDAVAQLEKEQVVEMSHSDKVKIVTNLLTVTCGDVEATPTVQL